MMSLASLSAAAVAAISASSTALVVAVTCGIRPPQPGTLPLASHGPGKRAVRQFSLTRPADKVRTPGPRPPTAARQAPTTGHKPPDGQNPAQIARSPGTH